jgi:hypothetical protein
MLKTNVQLCSTNNLNTRRISYTRRLMFAKVFSQIFDSSIAESHEVRHIFMDLLVLADATGVVDMTMHAISRRINVPLESVKAALEKLASPDPLSRSAKEDGRRIVLIDSHRDWGWQIVNYEHYRKTQDEEARRSYFRDYRKAEREKTSDKKKTSSTPFKSVQPCSTPFKNVTQEEGEEKAEGEPKEEGATEPSQSSIVEAAPSLADFLKYTRNLGVPDAFATDKYHAKCESGWRGRWQPYATRVLGWFREGPRHNQPAPKPRSTGIKETPMDKLLRENEEMFADGVHPDKWRAANPGKDYIKCKP